MSSSGRTPRRRAEPERRDALGRSATARAREDRFLVTFWGVRGSIPAPGPATRRFGGNTPCVEVRCGARRIVLDAGTGLRALGETWTRAGGPVEADVLLSHYHYDHLQGLPFFTPLFDARHRFVFHGPARHGRSVRDVLEGQMVPPYFPVSLADVARADLGFDTLTTGGTLRLGDVEVTWAELGHPGGSLGYRIAWRGRILVYATDVEHEEAPAPALLTLARDADLLVHDAMYLPEEAEAHRGWGHSTWRGAIATASAARVRRLVLFHHEPTRTDRQMDALLAHARRAHPATVAAREGMTLRLAVPAPAGDAVETPALPATAAQRF